VQPNNNVSESQNSERRARQEVLHIVDVTVLETKVRHHSEHLFEVHPSLVLNEGQRVKGDGEGKRQFVNGVIKSVGR
jgi:hypothetical protein